MKISIIGPGLMSIPPKGWGAVETLIWDMRNALIELGHEVDIINLRDPVEIIKQVNSFRPDFVIFIMMIGLDYMIIFSILVYVLVILDTWKEKRCLVDM